MTRLVLPLRRTLYGLSFSSSPTTSISAPQQYVRKKALTQDEKHNKQLNVPTPPFTYLSPMRGGLRDTSGTERRLPRIWSIWMGWLLDLALFVSLLPLSPVSTRVQTKNLPLLRIRAWKPKRQIGHRRPPTHLCRRAANIRDRAWTLDLRRLLSVLIAWEGNECPSQG